MCIPALLGVAMAVVASFASAEVVSADVSSSASLSGVSPETMWQAFGSSFVMIIVSELGDKTFFIAAILAMRQDRRLVWLGAAGALAAMTILSACIGVILPTILPAEYTKLIATLLFVYFGVRLLIEAYGMFSSGQGQGPSDELEETEKELDDKKIQSTAVQAFVLTFLAEWGDRSQIATIALSAARSPLGVTLGGVLGHACCTAIAVLGGRVLASRISERAVVAAGGVLFLAFAIHGAAAQFL
jgi:putative Ca2+/H+ antiporter (TMEM165/GDT1 family)